MKILALITFVFATGILSAFFGLSLVKEPIKYMLINIPINVCFIATITFLKGE